MTHHAHIDFETYSECDLLKEGSDKYATHPSTSVHCMAFCLDDGDIHIFIPGQSCPELSKLLNFAKDGGKVFGHNAGGFEILIWNNVCVRLFGWSPLSIDQIGDTMPMCYAMGLPGSLDQASQALGLNVSKDMTGNRIMKQVAKPRKKDENGVTILRYTPENAPEKFDSLYKYCINDVEVERQLYKRLLNLSKKEQELWQFDWVINRRGVQVDVQSIKAAIDIVERAKNFFDSQMRQVTEGAVSTCTATGQLTDWLKWQGLTVPSVAKSDVLNLLELDIPEQCRNALLLRQKASKTSTAKLKAMLAGACDDARIRGLFQYHGSHTGRWAGRRIQLQNLVRPKIEQFEIEHIFELLTQENPYNVIDTFYGNPMEAISNCVRGFLIPKEGYEFVGGDFSSVESRTLAWLAGEEDKLEVFRGTGKIYEHAAAGIYNVSPEEITKADSRRQVGKVAELALGFGGGVGAFKQMAKGYGVSVSDDEAEIIKKSWRSGNPAIVQFWRELEDAAFMAIESPGSKHKAGAEGRHCTFMVNGSFLFCKLPSGRVLCYPYPKIVKLSVSWNDTTKRFEDYDPSKHESEPKTRYQIAYSGVNQYTRKWEQLKTYCGKLCENVTQAVSRCLLSDAILRLEKAGHKVVAHVHDEVLIESFKESLTEAQLEHMMCDSEPWAKDLPVDAEAWTGRRYQK